MNRTAKPSSRCRSRDLLQDLALHDDVERGRRLVHDHELGLERERHRDDHALPHAAGELVRVRAERRAVDADELEQLAGARERAPLRDALVRPDHVDELVADAITGLSAFIALWKTIDTLRQRKRRSRSRLMPRTSSPRKRMRRR